MTEPASTPTRAHFKWQAATVAMALVAAISIVRSATPPAPPLAKYKMLAYLDERVGQKENSKDVRCWSSFNKLGMFITGCEINESAKGERIEQHMKLIQSLWEASGAKATDIIPAEALSSVLKVRFPQATDEDGVSFQFGGGVPTLVMADALRDYDDTIEPWRLLQTWASRNLDERGEFATTPVFGVEALKVMYNFLRSYDLAVQREARRLAMERREAGIGAEAMAAAFESSQRLEKP